MQRPTRQHEALVLCLATCALPLLTSAGAAGTPVAKVLPLLENLQSQIIGDGRHEQILYDRYQCWCEETIGRKVADITRAQDAIAQLSQDIVALNAQLGSSGAQIQQLGKDISENQAAQQDATEVRTRERDAYMTEHGEATYCIKALQAAIEVLTGAGSQRTSAQEAPSEAALLSAAANVRLALQSSFVWHTTPSKDMDAVRQFVAKPTVLLATQRSLSFSQQALRQNPFGDYAPQSTVIQGILKGMLDSYNKSIARAKVEEDTKQRAFDELMGTKGAELSTLQTTLQRQEADKAVKAKSEADSQSTRDDTKAQMDADETFLADTKASCKATATAWSERSRLRADELQGVKQAIDILSSPESQRIFNSSATTFVQLRTVRRHGIAAVSASRAYSQIRRLAGRYSSLGLAQIAVEMKSGGHFDKVIVMIDHLVEEIRKEEAQDIAHRDRCQNSQQKNTNDLEDLQSAQEGAQSQITKLRENERNMRTKLAQLESDMGVTNKQMEDRLALRNDEHEDFKLALKDDTDAVDVLQQAIKAIMAFYKKNRIDLELTQQPSSYTIDKDKPPELGWQGEYEGKQAESKDILSVLVMLVQDVELEIKTSRANDQTAQADYEKDRKTMEDLLKTQQEASVLAQSQLADLQEKLSNEERKHSQASEDLLEEQQLQGTLVEDCAWVETHFASRRDQRKAELDGLAEARSLLAGANKGDYDEVVLATER